MSVGALHKGSVNKPPGLHTPGTTPDDEKSGDGPAAKTSMNASPATVEVYENIRQLNREAMEEYGSYYSMESRKANGDCADWLAGCCLQHNCCKYWKDEKKFNSKPAFPKAGQSHGGNAHLAGKYSDPAYIAKEQSSYQAANDTLKRYYEGVESMSLSSEVDGEEWDSSLTGGPS